MIDNLSIKNFKSLRDVQLTAKRVNVIIGEANAGKSNLLEAMALLGMKSMDGDVKDLFRFDHFGSLFWDEEIVPIEVVVNNTKLKLELDRGKLRGALSLIHPNQWEFELFDSTMVSNLVFFNNANLYSRAQHFLKGFDIKYYRPEIQKRFESSNSKVLACPFGENLPYVVQTNDEVHGSFSEILKSLDYKLVISPHDNQIKYLKEGKKLTLLPFETLSDSLKRYLFYLAMVKSNEGASILLEEPDSHTFPYYTNEIAELIAKDEKNQYFIVTHNPFLLGTILDKTAKEDLQVNIAYRKDYATHFHQLKTEGEYSELMDLGGGMMLNLEQFYEKDLR